MGYHASSQLRWRYSRTGRAEAEFEAVGRLSRCRSRGVAWPNTRPCQGRERRFESGRDRHFWAAAPGEVAEWLKAAVSKTVMGHWPIESSNLSLSARSGVSTVPAQGLTGSRADTRSHASLEGPCFGGHGRHRVLKRQ